MANKAVEEMLEEKKRNSRFLSLANGDDVEGQVLSIAPGRKVNFVGDEVDVIKMSMVVKYPDGEREKVFENGAQKWLAELMSKDVEVGDTIRITRNGEGPKTQYIIKVLIKKGVAVSGTDKAETTDDGTEDKADEIAF